MLFLVARRTAFVFYLWYDCLENKAEGDVL